jgi:hypothetical protein
MNRHEELEDEKLAPRYLYESLHGPMEWLVDGFIPVHDTKNLAGVAV